MRFFKIAGLGALLVSTTIIGANAQDQPAPNHAYPPQVATNPGVPYSAARTPGTKTSPSTWIPSTPSAAPYAAAPNPGADKGSYYFEEGARSRAQLGANFCLRGRTRVLACILTLPRFPTPRFRG